MTWAKLRVPAGVATCRDICRRVAIGTGVMEFIPSGLRGSSDSLAEPPEPLVVAVSLRNAVLGG